MIQWPAVQDALAALFVKVVATYDTTLLDTVTQGYADPDGVRVPVYVGPPVTEDRPGTYVTVGYVEDDDAGTWRTERRDDFRVEETGTVRCHFVAQTGDALLLGVRDVAFDLVDLVDQALRADQTLGGVLSADGTCELEAEVRSVQNSSGAAQSLVVTVTYLTRS